MRIVLSITPEKKSVTSQFKAISKLEKKNHASSYLSTFYNYLKFASHSLEYLIDI